MQRAKLSSLIQVWHVSALNTCQSWRWRISSPLRFSAARPVCQLQQVLVGTWPGMAYDVADVNCVLAYCSMLHNCVLVCKHPWPCRANGNRHVACRTYSLPGIAGKYDITRKMEDSHLMRLLHFHLKCSIDRSFVREEPTLLDAILGVYYSYWGGSLLRKSSVDCLSMKYCTDDGLRALFVDSVARAIVVSGTSWTSSSHTVQHE